MNITAAAKTEENKELSFTVSSSERANDISAYESVLKDYHYAICNKTIKLDTDISLVDGVAPLTLDNTRYAFIELNNDGTDELIIGALPEKSFMVAYTISDDKPYSILTGGSRCNYSIGKNGDLYNWMFGGAPSQTNIR